MKTQSTINLSLSSPILYGISVWIVSLIIFSSIFFSNNLRAQEQLQHLNDTIWLHSGDSIACSIDRNSLESEVISTHIDKDGKSTTANFLKGQIKKIKIGDVTVYVSPPKLAPIPREVKFWVSPGFGIVSIGINGTVVFKNDLGISISGKAFRLLSANAPSDKSSPFDDKGSEISFCLVKEIYVNKTVRFGFKAGPSLVKYAKANYGPKTSGWFGSGYNIKYDYHPYVVGLTLRGSFEFLFARAFGMEVALAGNINKYKTFVGIELYFMFGRVKDKKKLRK